MQMQQKIISLESALQRMAGGPMGTPAPDVAPSGAVMPQGIPGEAA